MRFDIQGNQDFFILRFAMFSQIFHHKFVLPLFSTFQTFWSYKIVETVSSLSMIMPLATDTLYVVTADYFIACKMGS